jgi:1-acyl-sn-glycerol-3-phosphate acyltransferase
MIPARKSARFVRWFTKQTEKRIQKMFSKVYIRGEEGLSAIVAKHPVLAVSNHTSWWDPMFSIYLGHGRLKADAFAMMDAKNLRKLPFLGRIGGFGFDLDDPADRRLVLSYAARLLDRPGRLVWIFPEGAERPRSLGVDEFRPGAALVAKKASIDTVIPVGLRYEFTHKEHPEAFISIGRPLTRQAGIDEMRIAQAEAVRKELARIDAFVLNRNDTQFILTMEQRPSRAALLAERLLSAFTRYRG